MKTAFFRCGACNQTVNVDLDRGRIAEPTQCPRPACLRRDMMELIHNRSEFEDKQIVRLQETPGLSLDKTNPRRRPRWSNSPLCVDLFLR
jgi:DNA replication licensing factor MCM4